jgi:hypothetical protein
MYQRLLSTLAASMLLPLAIAMCFSFAILEHCCVVSCRLVEHDGLNAQSNEISQQVSASRRYHTSVSACMEHPVAT